MTELSDESPLAARRRRRAAVAAARSAFEERRRHDLKARHRAKLVYLVERAAATIGGTDTNTGKDKDKDIHAA